MTMKAINIKNIFYYYFSIKRKKDKAELKSIKKRDYRGSNNRILPRRGDGNRIILHQEEAKTNKIIKPLKTHQKWII